MDVLACATALSRPSTDRPRTFPSGERPRLSVIIVNYLHWEDTARLVRQLRSSAAVREGTAEIVIVDNHSPRNRIISWLRRVSGVSLRRWKSNRGFACAVNEGSRLAQGEWLLLLNPDTSVSSDFLDQVLARTEQLSDHVGIVGYQLHNEDGTLQHSTGPYPSLLGTLGRLLLPRHLRKYNLDQGDQPAEVDWVTGCALLVRRACYREVGGLDDAFFLYYEDVDLCRRVQQAGWSVWFDPTLSIVHHRPLHGRRVPPHLRMITRHALLTYAGKHWPRWQQAILGGIIRLEALGRRGWASMQRDWSTARVFAELDHLVREMLRDDAEAARLRLHRVIRCQEPHRAAIAVDSHPVPQSTRSAAAVPGQYPATRSAGHSASRR